MVKSLPILLPADARQMQRVLPNVTLVQRCCDLSMVARPPQDLGQWWAVSLTDTPTSNKQDCNYTPHTHDMFGHLHFLIKIYDTIQWQLSMRRYTSTYLLLNVNYPRTVCWVWRVLDCPMRTLSIRMTGDWESGGQPANPDTVCLENGH